MTKNDDQPVKINHNPNGLYIPDYDYRILIFGGAASGKTNLLLNEKIIKCNKKSTTRI